MKNKIKYFPKLFPQILAETKNSKKLELDEKKKNITKITSIITKKCINEFAHNFFFLNEKKGEKNLLPPPTWSLLPPSFFQTYNFKGPTPQAPCIKFQNLKKRWGWGVVNINEAHE